jgi:outer membrane receptor protein involved in Fe transport
VFRTELDDQQVTSFQGATFLVTNAATLISQGLELDASLAVTDSLEIGASLAYLDAEYDEYANAPCTIFQAAATVGDCVQDFSGERPPNAPEFSGTAYTSYERAIGSNLIFVFKLDAAYKDEYALDGDLDPNTIQDSWIKVNGRIGIGSADGSWDVALYGRNLTDEATLTFVTDAPLSAGIYGGWAEAPRVIGLQARYQF